MEKACCCLSYSKIWLPFTIEGGVGVGRQQPPDAGKMLSAGIADGHNPAGGLGSLRSDG